MLKAICRLIRSRTFLAVTFGSSFTYCILALLFKDSDITVESDYEIEGIPGGRRPLDHSFLYSASENATDDSPPSSCRNTVQGKVLIADDRGFVCPRSEMLVNGCCQLASKKYSCDSCTTNGCCSIYEMCVSCCLRPDKREILQKSLGTERSNGMNVLWAAAVDIFEFCRTICRTSSRSVFHENTYRNPRAKHCFGESPPVLETEAAPVVSRNDNENL
ncbi:SREBP regulating gene protein-like isoform X1 [Artemia franciscana]